MYLLSSTEPTDQQKLHTAYLSSVHATFITTTIDLHELQTATDYLQRHFFFLSFKILIDWQLSIWKCCKPSFHCCLSAPVFLATSLKYCSRGLLTAFFPDIAPSRMFTTKSLCLIVCPIHEWRLFCKIFKSNISSFAL